MAVESTFRRRILALAFQNLFHGVEKFFRLWVVRNLSKLEVNRNKMEMKKTNFKRNVRAFLSAISSLHTTARILAILANLHCLYGSSVWFLYGASVKYWGTLIKSVDSALLTNYYYYFVKIRAKIPTLAGTKFSWLLSSRVIVSMKPFGESIRILNCTFFSCLAVAVQDFLKPIQAFSWASRCWTFNLWLITYLSKLLSSDWLS